MDLCLWVLITLADSRRRLLSQSGDELLDPGGNQAWPNSLMYHSLSCKLEGSQGVGRQWDAKALCLVRRGEVTERA